jgi:FkbM family methyltransferase
MTDITEASPASAGAGATTLGVRGRTTKAVAAAGRRYPLFRGHSRIATHLVPTGAQGPDGSTEVALRCGPRILVRPNENVGRTIFFFGDLSPRLSSVCSRVLRPGDTVIDVGANYGVITLRAAAAVGPTGCVHAIEPQPGVAALLRRSIAMNHMDQVQVHEIALSDSDGQMSLQVPDDNLGAASLSRPLTGPGATFTVQVRTSGPFLANLSLGPVRLMKVDIEGHEPEFLRGAHDFLAAQPPDIIVIESNDHIFGPTVGPISLWERPAVQQLTDLGYEIVAIDRTFRNLFFTGLTRFQPGRDDDFGRSEDYVAIHGSRYAGLAAELGIKDGTSR